MTEVLDFGDQVRAALRNAMTAAGLTQAELSRRVGITPKHTCRVLAGRDGLSLELADEMFRVCGRRPVLRTQRIRSRAERESGCGTRESG